MKISNIKNKKSKTHIKNIKIFKFLVCVFYLLFFLPAVRHGIFYFSGLPALAISSTDLIQNAKAYDGKVVEYQGEAIGDLMKRGNHVWLNVSDGYQAIGVWGKADLFSEVKILGDYNYSGDRIKVVGIFHRACPEHGGDLDLHAQQITLIEKGKTISHPIGFGKIIVALVLLLGIMVLIFYRRG